MTKIHVRSPVRRPGSRHVLAALLCVIPQIALALTWTPQTALDLQFNAVTHGALWVGVGANGKIYTSPNGYNWTLRQSNTVEILYGVAYDLFSGTYIAVGTNGTALRSTDAINWSAVNTGTVNILRSVYTNGAGFIAAGTNGTILRSANGTSWSARSTGTLETFYAIGWVSPNQYVAVGTNGIIETSPDTFTWTKRASGTNTVLYGVSSLGLVLGSNGTILQSSDGVNWVGRSSGTLNILHSAAASYDGGTIIACGSNGTLLHSIDGGVNWSAESSGSLANFTSIEWNNDVFVTWGTGSVGNIAVSSAPPQYYSLTVGPTTHGTVSLSPNQSLYAAGTVVTATAIPDTGYAFSRWDGANITSQNPIQITVNDFKSITAIFVQSATPTPTPATPTPTPATPTPTPALPVRIKLDKIPRSPTKNASATITGTTRGGSGKQSLQVYNPRTKRLSTTHIAGTKWRAALSLKNGTNIFRISAIDADGDHGNTVVVKIIRK